MNPPEVILVAASTSGSYWLVWAKPGNDVTVVRSVRKPSGSYVTQVGPSTASTKTLLTNIGKAMIDSPDNYTNPPAGTLNIPGRGTASYSGGLIAESGAGGVYSGIADAVSSTLDFVKLISWLFHPRNILRAVEFLIGTALLIFGLHAAFQARGERLEGFTTSENALTRSELGRVATELGRSARGGTGWSQRENEGQRRRHT